tara:strand:- start:409 stop:747 length:339 start_codon:yes stop_codon:yes gene_type:complete
MQDPLWNIERSLWLDGVDAWQAHLAPSCIMAFGPTGVLQDAQIIDSLAQAPRWVDVTMSDTTLIRPATDVAVLAYGARARRHGAEPYQALCTSTYVRRDGKWTIAQHQQTPV